MVTRNLTMTSDDVGLCHQSDSSIDRASAWYRDNRDTADRPLIPMLRHRFSLTTHEAVMALREAKGGM